MDVERLLKVATLELGRRAVEEPPGVPNVARVMMEKAATAEDRQLLLLAATVSPGDALGAYESFGGTYKQASLCEDMGDEQSGDWVRRLRFTPLYGAALALERKYIGLEKKKLERAHEPVKMLKDVSTWDERRKLDIERRELMLKNHERELAEDKKTDHPKHAADLTAAARDEIKPKNFAVPAKKSDTGEGKYPIHDARHAATALSYVKQHGSDAEKRMVYSAIARRYPEMAARSSVPTVQAKAQAKLQKPTNAT